MKNYKKYKPIGRSSTDNSCFVTREFLDSMTAKKCMVLNTFFPKSFAFISAVKEKFNYVFVVTLKIKRE